VAVIAAALSAFVAPAVAALAFARLNADAKPDLAAGGDYALTTLKNVTP
jgi:hypothetical protein